MGLQQSSRHPWVDLQVPRVEVVSQSIAQLSPESLQGLPRIDLFAPLAFLGPPKGKTRPRSHLENSLRHKGLGGGFWVLEIAGR